MSIQLPPSDDTNALTQAIKTANLTNQPLILLPGVHYTKPGYGLSSVISLGSDGLTLSGTAAAIIQRPDQSIGKVSADNPLGRHDDNYGIYLVPARPLIPVDMQWQKHQPTEGPPIEYLIVKGGSVTISGLTLDCNMGKQGLEGLPKNAVEHSAMFAIRGMRYDYSTPLGQRTVFVGFEEVRLENLTLLRGGFADDLWFPPGYFRPNIDQVSLSGLVSQERVNHHRASVGFSGLSQRISIRDWIWTRFTVRSSHTGAIFPVSRSSSRCGRWLGFTPAPCRSRQRTMR
jgi:hypothetical protein